MKVKDCVLFLRDGLWRLLLASEAELIPSLAGMKVKWVVPLTNTTTDKDAVRYFWGRATTQSSLGQT